MNQRDDAGANRTMDCEQARMHFALLLYGELSFDEEEQVDAHLDTCAECRAVLERQRSLHAALDDFAVEPPAPLLRKCRAELAAALRHSPGPRPVKPGWWDRLTDYAAPGPILRPVAAAALVLLGFAGARLMPNVAPYFGGNLATGANQAGFERVSDVEPQSDGSVRIVVDQTQQKTITGSLDDQRVRTLLLDAVRDPNNAGLRADSVDLLTRRAQSAEIRGALIYLVVHDQNDGVRLKAMEGLRPFVSEPDVRGALSSALLTDANPGVRTQAIDLLIQSSGGDPSVNIDRATIGTLQQLMSQEKVPSVRQRCEKALELMNASAEIY
jgi:hypothetical protein